MGKIKTLLAACCLMLLEQLPSISAYSQYNSTMSPTLATPVAVDLIKKTVGDIPYDKTFQLIGAIPADHIAKIEFFLANGRDGKGAFTTIAATKLPAGTTAFNPKGQFSLTFTLDAFGKDFLLPNHEYTLRIVVTDDAGKVSQDYSFEYGFYPRTKIGDYTKLDFGLGYAPLTKALFAYSSVHIYFTPMNDECDLAEISNPKRNIFLRTSLFMGISPATLTSDTKQPIKNEFGAGNFVFGLGFRAPFYWKFMQGKNNKNSHTALRENTSANALSFWRNSIQTNRPKFNYFQRQS